jgi:hypothetical protein
MSFIKDAVSAAIKSTLLELIEVDVHESISIRDKVENLYSSRKSALPLWERLVDSVSAGKYNPDGWKEIGSYSYEDVVTLFFEYGDEKTMYSVRSCADVVSIMCECPGFVFYVTNSDCTFLICFNDHDYLIGAGEAKEWVLKQSS